MPDIVMLELQALEKIILLATKKKRKEPRMKLGTSNCFDLDTFIHDKTKRYTMQVHVVRYHVKK